MTLYENALYLEDVSAVAGLDLPWEMLRDRCILITGAAGMIGSFLVDVILEKNRTEGLNCTVFAMSRNREKAEKRFRRSYSNGHLVICPWDVRIPFTQESPGKVDYVIHLASNTHPMQYSTDPIGTITTNIIGLQNMLSFAVNHEAERFVFASSNEIYGENRGDTDLFNEEYCGYINCNTMRAGYPESKRCGEALCQAYKAQKGLDVVMPRLTRTYGPTMLMSDTKAVSQFIRNAIDGKDIVLKSAGKQFYSYQYMADSVSGLLTVMLLGKNGEAYNIADEGSDIMLKDLAETIARHCGRRVIYAIPDANEAAGYSAATKARLNGEKLKKMGWKPKYDINSGIKRTITILEQCSE